MIAATVLASLLLQPVAVTPATFDQAREPQIAIDGGKVYIAYGMGDTIYLSISTDQGATYGEPIKVGEAGKISLGMRRGPRICARKGVLTITAIYGAQGKGRDGDVVAFRSADQGETWSGPVKVNDVEGSAREGLHAMAIASDGTLACTWLDIRQKGTTLYVAISKDGGTTWSDDQLAASSPSGTICECCHPSAIFDVNRRLLLMFRNSVDGARDMYLTESGDYKTFTTPMKLGFGTWTLGACPMDGGMLSLTQGGTVETIWRRENTLYSVGGGAFQGSVEGSWSKEMVFTEGSNPWIAGEGGGPFYVWETGNRVDSLGPESKVRTLSLMGNDPVVTASADGKLVIAAWNESGIRAARLRAGKLRGADFVGLAYEEATGRVYRPSGVHCLSS